MGNEQQRGSMNNRYPGGYYTAVPSGAAVPTAQPVHSQNSSSSSRSSSNVAHPSAPPAFYNPSYQYYEDDSAARSREERAAASASRLAKFKVKKRVSEQSKAASWKKYDALGKIEEQEKQINAAAAAGPTVGYRVADSLKVVGGNYYQPNGTTGSIEQKSGSPQADLSEDDIFEQQVAALSEKVQKMPPSSVILLKKILANVLKAPEPSPSSTPSTAASRLGAASSSSNAAKEDPMKFRRLKLSNEKIAKEIVGVDGGMQLLLAVGFVEGVWNGDKVLTFQLKTPTDFVEIALEQLNEICPESNQQASANVTPTLSTTTIKQQDGRKK